LSKVRSNHRILDQQLLDELDESANQCAENLAHLLGSMRSTLHAVWRINLVNDLDHID
jgi:hypothetical protein